MPLEAPHPSAAGNPRVAWIQIQGRPILSLDFGDATLADSLAMLQALPKAFEAQDLNSVRVLNNLEGVAYDPGVNAKWKSEMVKFNPFIRACAVHGASGLSGVVTTAFSELVTLLNLPNSAMKIRSFKTRDNAVEWLLRS